MHTVPSAEPQPSLLRRIFAKRFVVYIVVAVVLGGGALIYNEVTGAPSTADVGDCMAGQNENDLKVVECTDASAAWKVETRVADISESEFTADKDGKLCTGEKTTSSFWQSGRKGRGGYVLCLMPAK